MRALPLLRGADPSPTPPGETRRRRLEVGLIVLVALAVVVFAVFGTRLPRTGVGSSLGSDVILVALINLNIILLVLLIFLVGRNLIRLVLERRQGVMGSRLRTRLVAAFVAVALFPAIILLVVAVTFMNNSIDRWFDVQVEQSLRGSIEVAQEYYQQLASTGLRDGAAVAAELRAGHLLRRENRDRLRAFLRTVVADREFDVLEVHVPAAAALDMRVLRKGVADAVAIDPGSDLLAEALRGRRATGVDQVGDTEVIRIAVPLAAAADPQRVGAVLVIGRIVPPQIATRKAAIDRSVGEYVRLKIQKNPIKTSYTIALVLLSVLVVFSASWLGFRLARGITVPIARLAEGTRAVAHGDWDHRIEGEWEDEIGTLVAAFNQMTGDLKAINSELDARRRYVETMLANIGGGVVSVDRSGIVTTMNKGAEAMLGLPARAALGRPYVEAFPGESCTPLTGLLGELLEEPEITVRTEPEVRLRPPGPRGPRRAERQMTITHDDRVASLMLSGARLRDDGGNAIGALVFLEDVTHILKVQRMEAWREVARRIAHEIKNPLTPIRLSAQRLRRRYARQLTDGGEVFEECTRTIEQQVDELKLLVNEFSNFARLPAGERTPQDLNRLVEESVVLFREGHREVEFRVTPAPDLPLLDLDRDGIKRALINILDNAVAACAAVAGERRVEITTRHAAAAGFVVLEIADSGPGMSAEVKTRLFEPYFSTKTEGTGLGLAIVNAIVTDHQAFIRVRDNVPRGSRFVIEFPVPPHVEAAAGDLREVGRA
jgi:two-component system nitrogen regulation sensor histidine kinase NtrY